MKRLVFLLMLGLTVVVFKVLADAQVRSGVIRFKMYDAGDTLNDRYARDTVDLPFSMKHSAQEIDGRFIFDSTTYDTGAFGNADTVVMVLKSTYGEGSLARWYTLDSVLKVFAAGGGINCTLNVELDTDSLGERLVLIYRIADTLNAAVAATAGDTAHFSIRYNILHRYRD